MKQYYRERFFWIFHYTSKNLGYVILKTLCLLVGLPIYLVSFVAEMVLTAVYMLFSFVPLLNVIVMVVCKALIFLLDYTFFISTVPDIANYLKAMSNEPDYEVVQE